MVAWRVINDTIANWSEDEKHALARDLAILAIGFRLGAQIIGAKYTEQKIDDLVAAAVVNHGEVEHDRQGLRLKEGGLSFARTAPSDLRKAWRRMVLINLLKDLYGRNIISLTTLSEMEVHALVLDRRAEEIHARYS